MAKPFNGQVPDALGKLRLPNAKSLSRSPQPQELRGTPPWAPHRETRYLSSHSQWEWIWGFKRNKASGLGWVSPSSTLWTCTFCWISQTPWGRLWTTLPTRDKPSSTCCRILQKVHFCAHFEIRYLESWTRHSLATVGQSCMQFCLMAKILKLGFEKKSKVLGLRYKKVCHKWKWYLKYVSQGTGSPQDPLGTLKF